MRLRFAFPLVTVLLLISGLAFGQSGKPLTNDDVVQMVKGGFDESTTISAIESSDTNFDTSVQALMALKTAGVSEKTISAMLAASKKKAEAAKGVAPAAAPTAPADPNDPNSPHDPGIYMYAKGKNGLQLTMLEPTVYSQGKSGGIFKSAMTYGIAKVKWKAVVKGSHANTKTGDSGALFYFYFEESSPGLSHASFGGTTTPNEFTLLKFEEKKDSRETVVMQGNVFGASSGTDQKANTGFTFTKLRPGVYKVVADKPLTPGEYCFLSSTGIGAFGAGSAGASRLFDFSVIPSE